MNFTKQTTIHAGIGFPSLGARVHATALFTLLTTTALIGPGCKPAAPGAAAGAPPPPQVTVAPAEARELVEWDEFTGRTAPVDFVEVRPRVSGHIEAVRFESGQLVKKGDILFSIDKRWHQAEFDRRDAELSAARIRVENAQREVQRNPQLLEARAISREEADAREARFLEAKAAVLSAEASRNSARLDLDFTEVRAPIDGRVSRALVTAGNFVGTMAGNPAVLTTLVSVDPIHVYVDMDENSLLRFKVLADSGALPLDSAGRIPVELQIGNEGGFAHKGFVESLDNRVDPQSGSIVLRASVPNPGGKILPGLFARLRLPSSAKKTVTLIDDAAIGTDQVRKFVLTLTSSNTVAYRPVVLGSDVNGKRVVRQGLAPGEKVVVNGIARVRPGMPVVPVEAGTPPAGSSNSAAGNH